MSTESVDNSVPVTAQRVEQVCQAVATIRYGAVELCHYTKDTWLRSSGVKGAPPATRHRGDIRRNGFVDRRAPEALE